MIAASFSDPRNARIIFFAAGGLVVLAIALVVATILWWRSSGIEPAALAPLEVMSTRSWRDSDDEARHELVESVRPQPDPRVGSPEAGTVVDRAQAMSGVSVLTEPRPAPAEDPFDAGFDEFDEFDQFDQFDAAPAAAPAPPSAGAAEPEAGSSFGLFDQFADDDLWGTAPPAPRRPIDPLLNDGDFW